VADQTLKNDYLHKLDSTAVSSRPHFASYVSQRLASWHSVVPSHVPIWQSSSTLFQSFSVRPRRNRDVPPHPDMQMAARRIRGEPIISRQEMWGMR
jgi:hypothetical protein